MRKIMMLLPFVAMIALIASCGGGSSGGAGEEGSGGLTVSSLSDVPDDVINPQAYDLTTQSASLSAPPSESVDLKDDQIGGFSRAGCETDTQKKDIIRNAIMPRMILCYVRAFEAASAGTAAGSGTFNYWRFSPPEGVQGPSEVDQFAPRVAIKQDGTEFTFVMCNEHTKAMELYMNTASGGYVGHFIDIWGTEMQHVLSFNTDGLPPADFTSAEFSQSFVEASNYFSGYGSVTLTATPTYNVLSGFHSGTMVGGGTFAGAVYAKFDADEGTAKYRMDDGSFPGQTVQEAVTMCIQEGYCAADESAEDWLDPVDGWLVNRNPCSVGELTADSQLCFTSDGCPTLADDEGLCEIPSGEVHTESFAIDNTNPLSLVFTVAATSSYADGLDSPPESSTAPTIGFTSASAGIDCSASDSWPALTFTSEPNMEECMALEEELNDWQPGDICANQEAQNNAGEGSGAE